MEEQNKSFRKFNQEDIFNFYKDIIYKWEPSSEVWAFKHGDDLTTGSVALTSFYITYFFRKQLKLRSFARLTCYMPIVGLSAFGAFATQSYFITSDILSKKKCPVCITTKASILQLTVGILYPVIMTPVITFHMADSLLTYPVPSISRAPKEWINLGLKIIKKNPRSLFIASAAQILLTFLVTQQKMSFVYSNWP